MTDMPQHLAEGALLGALGQHLPQIGIDPLILFEADHVDTEHDSRGYGEKQQPDVKITPVPVPQLGHVIGDKIFPDFVTSVVAKYLRCGH